MKPIASRRLVLEPLVAGHAREMYDLLGDPAIYEFENAPPESLEWLEGYYRKLESRKSADGTEYWLNWVVRLPGERAMGFVQATVYRGGWADVAYVFSSAHWGRGYASEAVEAMMEELAACWGVVRCEAVFKSANLRSRRLLDRLGFTRPLDAREIEADESRRVTGLPTIRRPGGPATG
ncbi:MAG: GNAT family N-acetyltransferase [Betaproteobacteria bacterium]|nr:GNAT family N-acetyltransferase [Betaproteobacteria bacterium]